MDFLDTFNEEKKQKVRTELLNHGAKFAKEFLEAMEVVMRDRAEIDRNGDVKIDKMDVWEHLQKSGKVRHRMVKLFNFLWDDLEDFVTYEERINWRHDKDRQKTDQAISASLQASDISNMRKYR